MKEKSSDKPKKTYHGVFSLGILFLLKTIFTCILAWVSLLIWFVAKTFYAGQEMVIQNLQAITHQSTYFIKISSSSFSTRLISLFDMAYHYLTSLLIRSNGLLSNTILQGFAQLLLNVTQIHLLRMGIFILSLPLLLIALFVSITDGLVKRDIRKFQGARESTFTFHRMKGLLGFCFFIPLFIYLSIPVAISPILILIPQIILFSTVAMLSITYFKKYL